MTVDHYPFAIVVNTDKSSGPGEHWVAVYVDRNGKGYYFDSYGGPPLSEIKQFLNRVCKNGLFKSIDKPIQAPASIVCG